jgi:hypothetical protein
MSLTQGGGQLPSPSIVPAFQGDVTQLQSFANSMGGQQVAPGAFTPQPGTTGAAGVGNNYFGAGGTGSYGIGALNQILSGGNLNPASNPAMQGTIQEMQQAFGQTLGQGTDSLNAQFAGSGQYGGDSGARDNSLAQFGRGAMSDFSNAMTNFIGNNYTQGQNQITSALGEMNNPLTGAGTAGELSQAPGQLEYAGQQAQNNLSSLPFQMMLQLMQATPISQPSYAPSSPNSTSGWLNFLGSLAGAGATAYAGSQQ